MKKRMRKLLAAFLTATLCAGMVAGCGQKDVAKEDVDDGELNIYIWTEYVSDEAIEGFEKEYGVKVNISYFTSNEEMTAKLASSEEGTFDIIQPADDLVPLLINEGMIQKLNYDNIPNMQYIDKKFLNTPADPNQEYTVPYMTGYQLIGYNKETCPIEIKSFADLADPALKDQLVFITSERLVFGMALSCLGYDPNTTDEAEIAEAAELLMKVKDNIKVFDGDSPRKELLNGECSAGFIYGGDLSNIMLSNPGEYGVAMLETGGYNMGTQVFCVPTGAKHKTMAENFINYIQRPEVMAQIETVYPYANVNTGAYELASDEYKNCEALNLPGNLSDSLWSLTDVGDALAIYDKYWSEFMAE